MEIMLLPPQSFSVRGMMRDWRLLLLLAVSAALAPWSRAVYAPAQWCENQPAFSPQAAAQCYKTNSTWDEDVEQRDAKLAVLRVMDDRPYHFLRRIRPDPESLVIYIHCAVLGHRVSGLLILDKLLSAIQYSGLDARASTIVVATGNVTHVREVTQQLRHVHVVTDLAHLIHFHEFPTLALMQNHARHLHPDTRMLYLHTKGVTRPRDRSKTFVREVMLQHEVHLHHQSLAALRRGYEASGTLLFRGGLYPYYVGNFFWATARSLARNSNVTDLVWRWRYAAEKWPLEQVPPCRVMAPRLSLDAFNSHMARWTNARNMSELHWGEPPEACVAQP